VGEALLECGDFAEPDVVAPPRAGFTGLVVISSSRPRGFTVVLSRVRQRLPVGLLVRVEADRERDLRGDVLGAALDGA
jgi:hypothetical protein